MIRGSENTGLIYTILGLSFCSLIYSQDVLWSVDLVLKNKKVRVMREREAEGTQKVYLIFFISFVRTRVTICYYLIYIMT